MSTTGSEMNGGSAITSHEVGLKIGHVFGADVMPKFARFAREVWGVSPEGKSEREQAGAGP